MIKQLSVSLSILPLDRVLSFWAQLFKSNDVVSYRFVKISNFNISNMPIFFVEKM